MSKSDAPTRAVGNLKAPPIYKVIVTQFLVTVIAALSTFALMDTVTAYSVLLGGMISTIPNAYFALKVFRYRGARQMPLIVKSMTISKQKAALSLQPTRPIYRQTLTLKMGSLPSTTSNIFMMKMKTKKTKRGKGKEKVEAKAKVKAHPKGVILHLKKTGVHLWMDASVLGKTGPKLRVV